MIISDATALIALINIDAFYLLENFTQHIIVPSEVYAEVCKNSSAKKHIDNKITEGFISVEKYNDQSMFQQIYYVLDAGESASIALAIEKKLPLIIDEKKGRKFAQNLGVEIIGIVGILRFLYVDEQMQKNEILEIIERLSNSDFRISQKLLEMILA